MWFQVEGWYWREPRAAVIARLKRTFDKVGLTFDEQLERQVSVSSMIDGVTIDVEVTRYTEDHVLLRMTSSHITREIHDLFDRSFQALIGEQNPSVGELVWGWNAEELAPLLMHSHWRGAYPSPLSILNPETLTAQTFHPHDDDYWSAIGPRVHFVHQNTLSRFNDHAFSAAALGDRLGRPALPGTQGILFDCGWSVRWPQGIPAALLAPDN